MRGTGVRCGAAALSALVFVLCDMGPSLNAEEIDAPPAQGPTARERVAEIHRRIQQAVVYPDLARRNGITGVSRVRFEVGHEGRARNIELADSSGHGLLDRAARAAVVEALGLPWVYGRLEVPVRFSLERES